MSLLAMAVPWMLNIIQFSPTGSAYQTNQADDRSLSPVGGKAHREGLKVLDGREAPQHGITEVFLRLRPSEFGSLDGGQADCL